MERNITTFVKKDLDKKVVFITGPRQVGKTTLSKSLYPNYDYFNYDNAEHRLALLEVSWDRKKPLIIFDELHKMRQWKRWLKGIYDTEGISPRIIVTGSAKLNTFKKVGDSMAGRYFQFRLHPLDIKEAQSVYLPEEAFNRIWNNSGFPEPFFEGDSVYYNRWKKTHIDIILRQDLIDLHTVTDIQGIETLIELLKINVGSTISYANLARSLERDPKTIKRWLQLLEELYIIFKVTPYSKKVTRSLLKEPKYYFYDCAQVSNENVGAKLENFVANALLKELHYLEDIYGATTKLHFLRTKDGKEVDFLVTMNHKPTHLIESKWSDGSINKNFFHFESDLPSSIKRIQLVKELEREKTFPNGIEIRDLVNWLAHFDFQSYINI